MSDDKMMSSPQQPPRPSLLQMAVEEDTEMPDITSERFSYEARHPGNTGKKVLYKMVFNARINFRIL